MTLQNFIDNNLDVQLDNGQGSYQGECVSLSIRVARDVYGVPYGTLYCSSTGGARDLYEQYDGTIPRYFDRIPNDPSDLNQLPQPGDLIVWGSTMGKYGHVGVVVSAKPLRVYQQLGTPVFKLSEVKQYASYNGVLGWLRPKSLSTSAPAQGGDMTISNREEGKIFYLMVQHRAASDKEADGIVGKTLEQLKAQWLDQEPDNVEWHRANDTLLRAYPEAINTIEGLKGQLASKQDLTKDGVIKYLTNNLK